MLKKILMNFVKLLIVFTVYTVFICYNSICLASKDNKQVADISSIISCRGDYYVAELKKSKYNIYASSTLKSPNDVNMYNFQKLFDGRTDTCWCPKGNGVGEFVIFKIPYGTKGISITNGLAASESLFKANNRVKELYLGIITNSSLPTSEYDVCGETKYDDYRLTDKDNITILQDSSVKQKILFFKSKNHKGKWENIWEWEIFPPGNEYYLIVGINSIYKGNKYNDTCISEIEIIQ